ncbi:hypothetical protein NDU88_000547 [Pleurodeles waltl]|uniref:Uncharacterized protein n=1 Tax=Pleurodeles waltl TaxID=8319 RepID=A0AAV7US72_PLEWA|nr:hypothetical protein NDU88_000547 [Pleurodeles waltl]
MFLAGSPLVGPFVSDPFTVVLSGCFARLARLLGCGVVCGGMVSARTYFSPSSARSKKQKENEEARLKQLILETMVEMGDAGRPKGAVPAVASQSLVSEEDEPVLEE